MEIMDGEEENRYFPHKATGNSQFMGFFHCFAAWNDISATLVAVYIKTPLP